MKFLLDNSSLIKLSINTDEIDFLKNLKKYDNIEFCVFSSSIEIQNECNKYDDAKISLLLPLDPKIIDDKKYDPQVFSLDTDVDNMKEIYNQIININNHDNSSSIHAAIAVSKNLILVTENNELKIAMKQLNYKVLSLNEIRQFFCSQVSLSSKKLAYTKGFVCYFDILGFGSFSKDTNNLDRIEKMIKRFRSISLLTEKMPLIGKISFFSDSFFFTVSNQEMKEATFFESILTFTCLARDIIQEIVGTDIRAGISYGEYIHNKNGEIYGPAVVDAVKLAEPKKEGDKLKSFLNGDPAAILINKSVFNSPLNSNNELYNLFIDAKHKYNEIEESRFFIVNPYYFIAETKFYEFSCYGERVKYKNLCRSRREIINKNGENKEKYRFSLKFLDEFEKDPSKIHKII